MILPVPGRILAALVPLATIGCGAPAPAPPAHHPTIVSLNPCADAIIAEVAAPGQLLAMLGQRRLAEPPLFPDFLGSG